MTEQNNDILFDVRDGIGRAVGFRIASIAFTGRKDRRQTTITFK